MSSMAAKRARREHRALNDDTEGRVSDFLTNRELGRVRQTEKRAVNRKYSPALRKIQRRGRDEYSKVDIPSTFWQQYHLNRITDIEKLLQDYEEDLSIAEERSVNINFAPGEIIAAKERILEQNLSEIDNRISLSKLMSELLYLHGLYPYILSIEELGKGN